MRNVLSAMKMHKRSDVILDYNHSIDTWAYAEQRLMLSDPLTIRSYVAITLIPCDHVVKDWTGWVAGVKWHY